MSSSSHSPTDHTAWLERISAVQSERATPEVLDRLRSAAEADRRHSLTVKRARRMSAALSLSSAAFSAGVSSSAATPARSCEFRSAMTHFSSPQFLSPLAPGRGPRTVEDEEAFEAEAEQELARAARQSVADGTLALGDIVQAVAQPSSQLQPQPAANLEDTLKLLEVEPADAAACAAKFELYEGFAKLTEDARTAVLELAASSQADLAVVNAQATAAQIQREVGRIDRADNLGLHEDPRGRWFVHGMCKASVRNQKLLDGVLTGIQRKLELLNSQTECPVCFDAFGPDRPATALSCAHKVCTECWEHWCSMAPRGHNVAPCPLCRHEEFLERVMRAASTPQPMPVD